MPDTNQFPPEVSQHAIWLCLRFTLSCRDVEKLLAERGLDVSYETIRRWVQGISPSMALLGRPRVTLIQDAVEALGTGGSGSALAFAGHGALRQRQDDR